MMGLACQMWRAGTLFRLGLKGDRKLKTAAPARHAVHTDKPAHAFNKLLTDCEPQSRPSMLSCGRSIGLHERLKNPCTGLRRDPNSRIGDGETHAEGLIGPSRDVCTRGRETRADRVFPAQVLLHFCTDH